MAEFQINGAPAVSGHIPDRCEKVGLFLYVVVHLKRQLRRPLLRGRGNRHPVVGRGIWRIGKETHPARPGPIQRLLALPEGAFFCYLPIVEQVGGEV